jgi:hypothetical protein
MFDALLLVGIWLNILIVLIAIVVLWAFAPIDPRIRRGMIVLTIVVALLILLRHLAAS